MAVLDLVSQLSPVVHWPRAFLEAELFDFLDGDVTGADDGVDRGGEGTFDGAHGNSLLAITCTISVRHSANKS